jgi:hypothetical protein
MSFEAEHKLAVYGEGNYGMSSCTVPFADLEGGYGSLDGYRKFLEMRRKIRADRIRMKQEQQDDAKEVLGRHAFYTAVVQP